MADEFPVLQVPTHTEKVAEYIRDCILSGRYKPGQRVNELQLSKSLRISRSPVREAIQQLAGEGLLQLTSYKGATVTSFDRAAIIELFEVREALDGMAARLAAERARPADIRELRGLLDSVEEQLGRDEHSRYPLDADYHLLVIAMARNERLKEKALEVSMQIAVARSLSGAAPDRALEALREHRAILGAISRGNALEAERLMRAHIRSSLVHTVAILDTPEAAE